MTDSPLEVFKTAVSGLMFFRMSADQNPAMVSSMNMASDGETVTHRFTPPYRLEPGQDYVIRIVAGRAVIWVVDAAEMEWGDMTDQNADEWLLHEAPRADINVAPYDIF